MTSRSRPRFGNILDGDLVCWKCADCLIADYVDLLAAGGPVPLFSEMTFACTKCSSSNRSPGAPVTDTAAASASGKLAARPDE